jgi:hypothetical protein
MEHYNIAQKTVINPFEKVGYFYFASVNDANQLLYSKINSSETDSNMVNAIFVNNKWVLGFDIKLLDFTTLIKWFEPYKGVMQYKNKSIHFRIDGDILILW